MARVEVDILHAAFALCIDSAGAHEAESAVDFPGHFFVTFTLGAVENELLIPGMDLIEASKTTFCEGSQQIEGGRGLVVSLEQSLRIRAS